MPMGLKVNEDKTVYMVWSKKPTTDQINVAINYHNRKYEYDRVLPTSVKRGTQPKK